MQSFVAQALKDCLIFFKADSMVPSFISENRIQKDNHNMKHEVYEDQIII